MSEKPSSSKKHITPDWLVQGVLTKIGDAFDRFTGRGWKPSSSLATSELIEKLKRLVDSEARESVDKRRFVPHHITLKMQWDKFSTDAEDSLRKLETQLLTALVDHINDKRYYTYAPLRLEVKPDYFTTGVRLFVGFEKFGEEDREAEMNVTIPGMKTAGLIPDDAETPGAQSVRAIVRFNAQGRNVQKEQFFAEGKRVSVGRTKENDLTIDDMSVSKRHATLMLTSERRLVVADTGSTNGTFVSGERIPYGKTVTLGQGEKLKVGTVDIEFEFIETPDRIDIVSAPSDTEAYSVGNMKFTTKMEGIMPTEQPVPATIPENDKNIDVRPQSPSIKSGSI